MNAALIARAAFALDATHAVAERGPRTFNARARVAEALDQRKRPSAADIAHLEAVARSAHIVMCQVSGGVTGTRRAPLKVGGVVAVFAGFADAEAQARALNAQPRPYATADFRYWPELAPELVPNQAPKGAA